MSAQKRLRLKRYFRFQTKCLVGKINKVRSNVHNTNVTLNWGNKEQQKTIKTILKTHTYLTYLHNLLVAVFVFCHTI